MTTRGDQPHAVSLTDPTQGSTTSGHGRPAAVWVVIAATALVGAGLQAAVLAVPPPASPVLVEQAAVVAVVTALLIGFFVSEAWVVHVPTGRQTVTLTLSDVPLVIALFALGPLAVVAVRVVGAAPLLVARSWRTRRKLAFNLLWYWVEACVAVLVWHGLTTTSGDGLGPRVWLAAAVTTVLLDALGTLLITAVVSVEGRVLPDLREILSEANPLVAMVNAAAALLVLHVAVADWRALWTVAVVVGLLVFAQQAHNRMRRRTESLEQLRRFTDVLGETTDVESAATTALCWMTGRLRVEQVELVLSPGFAGAHRGWRSQISGSVAPLPDRGLARVLDDALHTGPVRVRRDGHDPTLVRGLRERGVSDAMAMHLMGDGELVGTLVVAQRLAGIDTFQRSDLDEMVALGNHLSVTLRNARRADVIREHAEEELRRSLVDELTGLSTRRGVENALTGLERGAPAGAAVIVVDLDRFRDVNDSLGYPAGDDLLRAVAGRLRAAAPQGAVAARLHADHFAVLVPSAEPAVVDALVSSLRSALGTPFAVAGLPVGVSARLGLAVADQVPGAEPEPGRLLQQAVIAVAAASTRSTPLEVFTPGMEVGSAANLTLLTELREAIDSEQLHVHLQPKVDVASGAVVGAEALVRWHHPHRGPVPPDEFIPLAESTGLISPLTSLVLREALSQCASWQKRGHGAGVAVNMSPRSLLDPDFIDEVEHRLAASGVPASSLTLEITESSLMLDAEKSIRALHRLRALGVRLSIDDLGTGYSSLAYLSRLPVSEVKIDRAFLRPQGDGIDPWSVVAGMVDLGHRLGHVVVAEGVEDEAALHRLRRIGCDVAQGYWIGRPMDATGFRTWLDGWRENEASGLRPVARWRS